MALHILLTLFYLLLFNYVIYRFGIFRIRPFKGFVTNILFNLKFITGMFIWAVYTFYYQDLPNNDVHKFYTDAEVLYQSASESPHAFLSLMTGKSSDRNTISITSKMKNWERNFDEAPFNENRTIIRLNALVMFFSFRTYFIHILFMCLISLTGWVLLLNAVFRFAKVQQVILALLTMLLPSVLFWTSGVMKEPLLVLGLGLFMSGLLVPPNRSRAAFIILGLVILLMSKFFILAALIPSAVAFALFSYSNKKGVIIGKYLAIMFLLLVLAFNIQRVIPSVNPAQMLINKQQHSIKEAAYFNAGSRIVIPSLTANAVNIVCIAPVGIWNTLFRPYPWEGKNIMMLASAMENLLVLLFIVFCLLNTDFKDFKYLNIVLMLLVFSLAYFALIGICTPVLGNLVRYRAPVLPFFLFALILNINNKGILNKLAEMLQFAIKV